MFKKLVVRNVTCMLVIFVGLLNIQNHRHGPLRKQQEDTRKSWLNFEKWMWLQLRGHSTLLTLKVLAKKLLTCMHLFFKVI